MSGTKLEDMQTGRSATQWATMHCAHVAHVCKYKIVTSDATGLDLTGGKPSILYGVIMVSAGTLAGVYDATTVTGTAIIPSTTVTFTYQGYGVLCPTGITADWTSGTWLVLYAFT
jgi:hypothetical protein